MEGATCPKRICEATKNEQYIEAKAYRVASLKKEEAHKLAISQLCEEYATKIEEAFTLADNETVMKLHAKKLRLDADQAYSRKLGKERQRFNVKLEKERKGEISVASYLHKQWIKNMARNMTNQKEEHKKETAKLQKTILQTKKQINKEHQKNQER